MVGKPTQETKFSETGVPDVKRLLAFQPNWVWAMVLCFVILALKNGLAEVFYPLLYNEDGRNLFAVFYNDHSFRNIFISYAGYIRVFPNLTAYLIGFFPVTWIPALYALASLGFTALTYALFFLLLDRIFRHKGFALYAVLILVALPLGSFKMVGTLMFQIWHCDIVLFLLAFLPMPRKPVLKMAYLLCVNVLIWSHPYTILILPVYLYLCVQGKHRWEHGLLATSLAVYFLFGLQHHPLNWGSLAHYPSTLLGRVATETVVGPLNRTWLQYMEMSLLLGFVIIAVMAGVIATSWKTMKGQEKGFYTVSAYFILATLGVALMGRQLGEYYHLINGSPRYTYLPRIGFCVMGLAVLFQVYRQSALFRKAHWLLAGLVLILNTNVTVLYKTDRNVGQSVRDYVAYLDQNRLDCGPGEERWFTLRRGGWQHPNTPADWSIPANLCRH